MMSRQGTNRHKGKSLTGFEPLEEASNHSHCVFFKSQEKPKHKPRYHKPLYTIMQATTPKFKEVAGLPWPQGLTAQPAGG